MNTSSAALPSNYDPDESDTAVHVLEGKKRKEPVFKTVDFGPVQFSGDIWQDDVCLYQIKRERTINTGRLCVHGMEFLATDDIIG